MGQERPEFHLFLDECGNHNLNPGGDQFPVFCLCGVIVAAEDYATFDAKWKGWKEHYLGDAGILVHEPKVRSRSQFFYRKDPTAQDALLSSLEQILGELEFTCIAAVIDKRRFADLYEEGKVDDFLPSSAYLMCVDFVFERFVHFLHAVGHDGRGLAQAESRGPREDAEVHAEFLRLHLQGTQWQPEGQFRHALRPYMEFRRKSRNVSGLEIADLVARPIAEKVLDPTKNPVRWNVIEPKLYDGGKGRKASYGLKIFPWIDPDRVFDSAST